MAFCPHCGATLNAGASFCTACGASVAPAAPGALAPPGAAPLAPAAPAPLAAAGVGARPPGVTIIGIVILVGSGFMALAIGAMLVMAFAFGAMGAAMDSAMPWFPFFGVGGAVMATIFLFAALFMGAFVAVGVVTGIGVLKGRSWAWALTLVIMGLVALNGLGSLASQDWSGVLGLIVAGLCIWYFFQPEVKRWFGKA